MNASPQARRTRRPRPALNPSTLRALGLHYAGRYATTRARLLAYLGRKIRERGWAENEAAPDIEGLADDFARLGYVDDDAYASAKANALLRRGYGSQRIAMALRQAGIDADAAATLAETDDDSAFQAALSFARRRRIGPFGSPSDDRKVRARALAALVRAGHSYDIAGKILDLPPNVTDSGDFLR